MTYKCLSEAMKIQSLSHLHHICPLSAFSYPNSHQTLPYYTTFIFKFSTNPDQLSIYTPLSSYSLFFFSSLCLWPLFLWEFLLPSWLDSISKTEIVASFLVWKCLDGFQSPITVERALGTEASYLISSLHSAGSHKTVSAWAGQDDFSNPPDLSCLHFFTCSGVQLFSTLPTTSSFEYPPDWENFLSSHKEILSPVLQWPFALIIRGLTTIHWTEWNFPGWNDGSLDSCKTYLPLAHKYFLN